MILATLCFLGASQGFDTPITISEKDVTLPEICNEIGVKSGLKIDLEHVPWNDKVTVFVKDMKARDLLDKIASLYDLDGSAIEGRYRLKLDFKAKKAFEDYVQAEYELRMNRVWSELRALAKLTLKPFGAAPAALDKNADEATKWAAQHIGQAKYYAAGLWERATEAQHPGMLNNLSSWDAGLCSEPNVFWVGFPDPPTPRNQIPIYAKNYMDENSKALEGTIIAVSGYETTAELQVTEIPSKDAGASELLDRPFLFAHPPKELEKTPFAVRLAAWQTPVNPDRLGEEIKNAPPFDDPGYFDGRISLSEKLQNLHNRSGVQIVATSFRTPALEQDFAKGASPADLLADIEGKEEAFVRWDKDCLLVRHPAYWILQCSEPPESAMQEAEKIASKRTLSVFEYGGLAHLMSASVDDEPPWLHAPDAWEKELQTGVFTCIPRSFERLPKARGFLSRFDPEPLERAFPILTVLGSMETSDLERFASGQKLEAGKTWISGLQSGRIDVGTFTTVKVGGKVVTGTTTKPQGNQLTPIYSGTFNPLPDFAADLAPLFPSTISDKFLTLPERRGETHIHFNEVSRAPFLWLDWADNNDYRIGLGYPDEPTVVYNFTIHPNPVK